ncbi:Uncharacterised protein [Mycobacteroides abscessus subsp. abscessus]|nr:Uncharacterised protein [Mycobacteroides abscessus subsp. abscessus]
MQSVFCYSQIIISNLRMPLRGYDVTTRGSSGACSVLFKRCDNNEPVVFEDIEMSAHRGGGEIEFFTETGRRNRALSEYSGQNTVACSFLCFCIARTSRLLCGVLIHGIHK